MAESQCCCVGRNQHNTEKQLSSNLKQSFKEAIEL